MMPRSIFIAFCLTVSFLTAFGGSTFGAENASIHGFVKDAQTGEPLPGANVLLVGTSLGASTDLNGRFVIRNVPAGSYTVRTTYIGYKSMERPLKVEAGANVEANLELEAVGVQGKEVVVTAQASGQNQAINQQLSSQQIANVVSAARIQELPDANAAESVGRLPGISVLRSGGEGNQVVIRGLAPKYNEIMINGVEMTSSDPNNRSVDLSMISSNMLEGIEVKKTVTPDMDANVIGGVVNFELREAQVTTPGVPQFNLLAQGGYNNLSDAYNKFNNYKYVGSAEDRFFNERFGVFAQADVERKNLTSNEFGASYTNKGNSDQYITQTLNLNDIPRDRRRYNGTIVMDYRLPEGTIKFSNFLSTGTTDIQNRGETFDVINNLHNYSLAYSTSALSVITNALHIQYQLPIFHVNAILSHAYSETKNPNDWTVGFQQASAGIGQFLNVANLIPQDIPRSANNDTNLTYLSSLTNSNSFSRSRALTASLDLESNVNFSDLVTSVIKFGGSYRHQTRSYAYDQSSGQGLGLTSAHFVDSLIASHFPSTSQYANTTSIPIAPFLDPNFSYGTFLGGSYPMVLPLNFAMLSEMARYIKANTNHIAQTPGANIAYFTDQYNSTTYDYSGYEDQSAAYIMATVNVGPDVTLIPGVRFQNLQTTYTAPRGHQTTASATGGTYIHNDTTLTVSHGFFLPDVALRVKPFSWFDVRLSYTNTIAYPDYNAIVPRIDVSTGNALSWNNYQLVPSRSTNYDAYFSFYDNSIGLITVGGFLKQINNLIYPWTFHISGGADSAYFPPSSGGAAPTAPYFVSTYVNDPYRVDDWGLEFDWQTHFWYLPQPLNGPVFNVNYTPVFPKARYPYTQAVPSGRVYTYVDTSFTDRLLYQPDNIANLSVGYDYRGFSIRVSMIYQDNIFSGPNFWPQLRTTTAAYTRWDLSAKQTLPWYGLELYGDLSNINSENDIQVIQAPTGVPQSEQSYGMTADLGLRVKF